MVVLLWGCGCVVLMWGGWGVDVVWGEWGRGMVVGGGGGVGGERELCFMRSGRAMRVLLPHRAMRRMGRVGGVGGDKRRGGME